MLLKITLLHPMYYTKHRFTLILLFASFPFSHWQLSSIMLKTRDKTCLIIEIDLRSPRAIGDKKQCNEWKSLHALVNLNYNFSQTTSLMTNFAVFLLNIFQQKMAIFTKRIFFVQALFSCQSENPIFTYHIYISSSFGIRNNE